MTTTVKDHGWDKIEKQLKKFYKSELVVGVLDAEVAEYATHNEFGAPKANVPERSFIRSTMAEKALDIQKKIQRSVDLVMSGKMEALPAIDRIGLHVQGLIQKTIRSGVGPENAPSTVLQKGHGETLRGGTRRLARTKKGRVSRTRAGEKKYKYTGGGRLMKSISFEIR